MAYIRVAKGLPTADQQRATLLAGGLPAEALSNPWEDRGKRPAHSPPDRELMLGALRDGDEVWVARLGVLGTEQADIIEWVRRISALGATLVDASTGERFRIPPECQEAADSALRIALTAYRDSRAAVLEKARARRTKPAGKPAIEGARLEVARVHWFDHSIDGDEAARRAGVSKRTLHRYFGPRETPAFGAALNKRRGKT